MQAPLKKQEANAQPTPPIGKVDIHAAREGLAMVMDGLRVMDDAGVKISKATILFDGKTCVLPVIEIPGYMIGITVMEVMEGNKKVQKSVFTTNGVSVMDKLTVMDERPLIMEGEKK